MIITSQFKLNDAIFAATESGVIWALSRLVVKGHTSVGQESLLTTGYHSCSISSSIQHAELRNGMNDEHSLSSASYLRSIDFSSKYYNCTADAATIEVRRGEPPREMTGQNWECTLKVQSRNC